MSFEDYRVSCPLGKPQIRRCIGTEGHWQADSEAPVDGPGVLLQDFHVTDGRESYIRPYDRVSRRRLVGEVDVPRNTSASCGPSSDLRSSRRHRQRGREF
jgi:hypothetical protein